VKRLEGNSTIGTKCRDLEVQTRQKRILDNKRLLWKAVPKPAVRAVQQPLTTKKEKKLLGRAASTSSTATPLNRDTSKVWARAVPSPTATPKLEPGRAVPQPLPTKISGSGIVVKKILSRAFTPQYTATPSKK
jgi:hypothetical protein